MFVYTYIYIYNHQHHQSVLPKGRSFAANSRTPIAVLSKGKSSTANSGTKVAVLLGMNRYFNFLLHFSPHSLFSIRTDLKRSEKIPGAPTWRWGEWIWLTGSSGLHGNSPQGLNIGSIRVFDKIRDLEVSITLRPLSLYIYNLFLIQYVNYFFFTILNCHLLMISFDYK